MPDPEPVRTRREPPPFVPIVVRSVERPGTRLARVTFEGEGLDDLAALPAASVRLLLPRPGALDVVVPTWTGNQFLLTGGERPVLRTFTPRASGPGSLVVEIVVHDGRGAASTWAAAASPGARAAVSGPGRGYVVDDTAPSFFLAGDETAVPAMSQLLEVLPATALVAVHIELAVAEARLPLPHHPGASAEWHVRSPGARPGDALVAAVEGADIAPDARLWIAGEAAAVQRIRRHLFDRRGIPRARATVRGYWQLGRT